MGTAGISQSLARGCPTRSMKTVGFITTLMARGQQWPTRVPVYLVVRQSGQLLGHWDKVV